MNTRLNKKFFSVLILSIIFYTSPSKSYGYNGFIAGPRLSADYSIGIMKTHIVLPNKVEDEKKLSQGGGFYLSLFGGWVKSFAMIEVGGVLELGYKYNSDFVLSPESISRAISTNKKTTISYSTFEIPILFRLAIPVLKFYTGPRLRFIFGQKNKLNHENTKNKLPDFSSFCFDWYSRLLLGFQVIGIEAGVGIDVSMLLNQPSIKLPKNFISKIADVNLVASIQYDILQFFL